MSHLLKVFLKIILKRIYWQYDANIAAEEFGFRIGFGTRDALFGLQVQVQRGLDMDKEVYLCFNNYQKAFDYLRHGKMLETLTIVGIDNSNLRAIAKLYCPIREYKDQPGIKRGVRQGCVLSPTLFNLYAEGIIAKALEKDTEGIIIKGKRVNNLRYADGTVLIASTAEELQSLLNKVNKANRNAGIVINVQKTQVMTVCKNLEINLHSSQSFSADNIDIWALRQTARGI